MFLNQGTSQPQASQEKKVKGDMASWEELVELDDVQLATVVGGIQMKEEPEPGWWSWIGVTGNGYLMIIK